MPGYIHHIQWCVSNLEDSLHTLMEGYKFYLLASREGQNKEAVLQSGDIKFLISERTDCENQSDLVDSYPWLRCTCRNKSRHEIDSVFNVCLEVGDVDKAFSSMTYNGSETLHPPKTIKTSEGFIRYAVVTSPCDNVIHSLVNTKGYTGVFLPGFSASENFDKKIDNETGYLTHIDHVTYVGNVGDTERILNWYRACCGMERFVISQDDDPEIGTVFDDVGMKLNVGDWLSEWMCREDGVMWYKDGEQKEKNFKLVIAEPLADREDSHVHSFLRDHGGPGLQHIGLSTENITSTMTNLRHNGALFRKPPPTYYDLEGKKEEILKIGEDPKIFKELGILIDPEDSVNEDNCEENYLLQLFSFPLFGKNTFFLEIIQRQGSRGFGGGNIRALSQSIVLLEKQHTEQISNIRKCLTRSPSRPLIKSCSETDFGTLYTMQLKRSKTNATFNMKTSSDSQKN